MNAPLLPECNQLLSTRFIRIDRNARLAFLASFLVGLLAHGYLLTNKLINRDEIPSLFASNDRVTTGRFLIGALRNLFSDYSLPVVNGLVTILALSLVAALVVSILRIKRPFYAVLTGAVLITFPSVSNFFTYLHTADANAMGLLIGVYGAYLLERHRWGFLPAIPLFMLSLATYQVNICFLGALLATRGLQLLLSAEHSDATILRYIGKYVLVFGMSALAYSCLNRWILDVRALEYSDYMGVATAGNLTPKTFLRLFGKCYTRYNRFLQRDSSAMTNRLIPYAHMGLISLSLALTCVRFFMKKHTVMQFVLSLALLAILPVAYNSISLFNPETIHYLMLYPIAFTYILPLVLLDALATELPWMRIVKQAGTALAALAVAFIVWCWGIYANQGYLVQKLKYENSFALLNRVVERIESTTTYSMGEPIVFIGKPSNGAYPPTKEQYYQAFYSGMGFGNEEDYGFIDDDLHIKRFIKYYIGVDYPELDDSEIERFTADQRVQALPCYPSADSIAMMDGCLVVKLGMD